MFKKLSIATILVALGISGANAHSVWAGMRGGELQICYGEGPLDDFYNPQWLESVKGFDENFNSSNVLVVQKGKKVFLKPNEKTQVIAINSDNGYWSNTKKGWINKAKDENPEATKGKHHSKMSVNYISQDIIFGKSKALKIAKPKAVGLEMEIVPEVDPRFLKQGDSLNVRLIHNNKPMVDTNVMYDVVNNLGKGVKTDKDGYATIKVSNSGFNMIGIETAFPRSDKTKADSDGYFTALTFTIMPQE